MRQRVINYILERKCRNGGFCFYKLEEPNGSDTYFALAMLDLLGISFMDRATISYLKAMQYDNGGYNSIQAAFYALKGLTFLHEKPRHEPAGFLMRHLRSYSIVSENLPTGITSIFKPMMYLIDLIRSIGCIIDEAARHEVTRLMLHFQNEDKGFGAIQSTLMDTASALIILKSLNYPIEELQAGDFVRLCETPLCGFTNIPHTSLSFMEYVHAGIVASVIMSKKPFYFCQCVDFIKYCQNNSGGFSRAVQGGIATLEDSYYAIHGLTLLSTWKPQLCGED